MQPPRLSGGFLLTSPLDALPFEQDDQKPSPLDALPFEQDDQKPSMELTNFQNYGTTTPTPPIIDIQSADPPRQASNSDNAGSDANATSTDVQSQTHRSQQRSRDGYVSLPASGRGKKESHSMSTF